MLLIPPGLAALLCVLVKGCSHKAALMNLLVFQEPQHESKDKKLKFFSSGEISMDVDIEKTGFLQGESSHGDTYQSHATANFDISGLF